MADASDPRYELPNKQTIEAARDVNVFTQDGDAVRFHTLWSSDKPHKTLIVFIRHFFCGNCEDYIRTLGLQLSPQNLRDQTPSVSLKIIGCGASSLINGYIERTGSPFEIYTDPERKLYKMFGMVEGLGMGTKPEYMNQRSDLQNIVQSTWNAVRSPFEAMKSGKSNQNGAEMLFNEVGELKWFHRMQNTRDHAEVSELREVIGMAQT